MEGKNEWLFTRQQQIVAQLSECQAQTKQALVDLSIENANRAHEIAELKETIKQKEAFNHQQIAKHQLQIKTLEALLLSKDRTLEQLTTQHKQITASANSQTANSQKQYTRILELEHLLAVEKENSEKIQREWSREIQARIQAHQQEVGRMKREFDELLSERQSKQAKAHQEQLAQMKKENLFMLQKIEQEYQAFSNKTSESSKQTEMDCSRLVAENTRLLAIANENKMKILTLESTLNALQQQNKLIQKQIEVLKENNRREVAFLKQQKITLTEKNKKMAQKLEELTWANKETDFRKEEEVKKIRREVDRSFQEVLERAEAERKTAQEANQKLKQALQDKSQELQQMQGISLRIKELYQNQEKELLLLKQELDKTRRQKEEEKALHKPAEQIKNQLIRKNCQNQVLQEQIKRLKTKVNTAVNAQQQSAKNKELLLEENKMLLAEIVFLKGKEKEARGKGRQNLQGSRDFLNDMSSDRSRDGDGQVQQYKKIIQMMSTEMNDVSRKIIEKDAKIERLEALVRRLQNQLRDKY